MHLNILIGSVLVILTTFVHAMAMMAAIKWLKVLHIHRWVEKSDLTRTSTIAALVLVMFIASLVESGLWALTYLMVGALSGLEQAFYFSMVTYTTLGFGDVVLEEGWRVLSSFEAANGIIMFGWTTALIVAAVQRVYFGRELSAESGKPLETLDV
jgi:hypothetical protein